MMEQIDLLAMSSSLGIYNKSTSAPFKTLIVVGVHISISKHKCLPVCDWVYVGIGTYMVC